MADVVSFLDHLPKGAAISEEQIAAQFVLEHADRLLYCHARKQWFSFDGSLWRAQKLSEATWYARQVTTRYSQRAKNQTAMETQKRSQQQQSFDAEENRKQQAFENEERRKDQALNYQEGRLDQAQATGLLDAGEPSFGLHKTLAPRADR